MKISSKTKIAAIIKHNPEAIEALISVNPHFSKLRNPVLRSLLAPRVTVEDAAAIGKCNVSDIFNKLKQIGFEIENNNEKPLSMTNQNQNSNILEQIYAGKVKVLDVRPILKSGTDPFNLIMEELKTIPDGYVLEIVNSFEPTPLIKILMAKGYTSFVKYQNDVVHTYFLKLTETTEQAEALFSLVNTYQMVLLRKQFENRIVEIDVRDLEMPLPMVTILSELETLKPDYALFVHHKKIPQYLLPEIRERKFTVSVLEVKEGEVKLFIHKKCR